MLSVISLKVPRFLLKAVLAAAFVVGLVVFVTINTDESLVSASSTLRNVFSKFNSTAYYDRALGAHIHPQDVLFLYVPLQGGGNGRQAVLSHNSAVYDKVMAQEVHEPKDFDMESIRPPEDVKSYQRESATIVALVRNNEIGKIKRTIVQFEEKFNKKFEYPYTFINDQPFSENFKNKVRSFTNAEVFFVQLAPDLWQKPDWIDRNKEQLAMAELRRQNVAYAQKESYHNMCRFYSGAFYHVPELRNFRYYWRIEPDVKFFSDINYDVFKYLAGTGKIYGFTINIYDIHQSVESLLPETLKFLNTADNYKYVNKNGAFQWITENRQLPEKAAFTGGYSTCHFWSNFEIGDMDFFRGEAYSKWFQHLDSTGKFYYERWGDAPVHSLGLALFADKSKVHWFRDIGYYHAPYVHCPNSKSTRGCDTGNFGPNPDQNCMGTWIEFEMEDPAAIY